MLLRGGSRLRLDRSHQNGSEMTEDGERDERAQREKSGEPASPNRMRWAARVSPALVLRLYAADAQGLADDDLAQEVGYALYDRCQSILRATEAHTNGRVVCPGCGRFLPHNGDRAFVLECAGCAFRMTWGAYRESMARRRLRGGGAVAHFRVFAERWERAEDYRERILAIDALIHAFHVDAKQHPTGLAARNVLDVNTGEALALLDALADGGASTPELRETWTAYRRDLDRLPLVRRRQRSA